MRSTSKKVKFWLALLLCVLCMGFFGFVKLPQAHATSFGDGCEHRSVALAGHTYYQCTVIASHGLNVRNATSFAIEAGLSYGATIYVARQIRHSLAGVFHGGPIWDVLKSGQVVSDYYVSTSRIDQFSPPIPNASAPATTPTTTATPTDTPTATPKGTATPTATPTDAPTATAGGTATPTATPTSSTSTPGSYDSANSRLFADSSPWNMAIGPSVQLDPNSGQMVSLLANGIHVAALYQYGMPIYTSTASDPSYTVKDTGNDSLFEADQPIHIPNNAAPSPGSDHWLFIYDSTKHLLFEMWNTNKSGGTWSTQTGNVYSPTGDGVLQTDGTPQAGNGASYFGGVVTNADAARGSINHALSLASQYTSSAWLYPMVASDGHTSGGIPMGARLQLDPSVDCATLPGASVGEKMVCVALQTYGGYMRDTGGVPLSAYFEGENLNDPNRNPPTDPGDNGLSSGAFGKIGLSDGMDLSAIPWDKLRVLKAWNSFTGQG